MIRKVIFAGIYLLLAACQPTSPGTPVVIQGTAVPPLPPLETEKVEDGRLLYGTYCAACHGVNLEGQPNWKNRQSDGSYPAPPHDSTGHTWHHPDETILEITRVGGDPKLGSKMPGFENSLTDEEMGAILSYIKSSWGQEERSFQWWITAR